jgi:hypothetical protein
MHHTLVWILHKANCLSVPLRSCVMSTDPLAESDRLTHPPLMFIVSKEVAAAIRTAYEQDGELSAAIELRRLFPGITDNARARECARTIAGWTPLPAPPVKVVRLRPRGKS